MGEKATELAELVKVWWEHHKYDTTGDRGDYNAYDDEPDFVIKAKEIIGDWERIDV
jgi:hypothetical protein